MLAKIILLLTITLLVSFLSLTACHGSGGIGSPSKSRADFSADSSEGAGIVGGVSPEADLSDKMVRINLGDGFCSGEQVAPGWILTAAHCTAIGGDAVSVKFRSGAACKALRSFSYPGWGDDEDRYPDLALIEIACKDAASPVVRLVSANASVGPGMQVSEVGIGEGGYRQFRTVVESVHDFLTDPKAKQTTVSPDEWRHQFDGIDSRCQLLLKSDGNHRNGEGDSGGGIFSRDASGQTVLVGVITDNQTVAHERSTTIADAGTNLTCPKARAFFKKYLPTKL